MSPFYLNALTFGAFMVLILASKVRLPPPEPRRGNVGASVVEGFKYVRENAWMGTVLLTICGLSFFGFSFIILIPAVCKEILLVSEHYYGFLMGMTGLGALAGMTAVATLRKKVGLKAMMSMGAFLTAAFLLAFTLSSHYWLSCLLAAGTGGELPDLQLGGGGGPPGKLQPGDARQGVEHVGSGLHRHLSPRRSAARVPVGRPILEDLPAARGVRMHSGRAVRRLLRYGPGGRKRRS